MVDSQGSSLAHWAAQNSDPTPVLKILRDLGCPLKAVNKVTSKLGRTWQLKLAAKRGRGRHVA